jgi:hypothetical protein
MKLKTQDLTGPALDWAVAKCEAGKPVGSFLDGVVPHPSYNNFHPSTIWPQGGPIIEREGMNLNFMQFDSPQYWAAHIRHTDKVRFGALGPTPLIAAMRCYVASKLGDEVEIPEELL